MADETVTPKAEGAPAGGQQEPRQQEPRQQEPRHSGPRPSGPRPAGGQSGPGGRKFFRRKKVCKFCVEKIDAIRTATCGCCRALWPNAARLFRAG